MPRACIGLGSNLGSRREHLEFALRELSMYGTVVARSPLIETDPVDCPEGGRFLNACMVLDTALNARRLLAVAIEVEDARGRERSVRNGPRPLDIDLLLIDDLTIESESLTIPHPRMHERRFVLEPLAVIAPGRVHPGLSLTVRQMLGRLDSRQTG